MLILYDTLKTAYESDEFIPFPYEVPYIWKIPEEDETVEITLYINEDE